MGNTDYDVKDELNEIISKMNNWYKNTEEKVLNIISVPFNTSLIFKNIILSAIEEKKKVLYIWGDTIKNYKLLDELCEANSNISSEYIVDVEKNSNISFTNFKAIDSIKNIYDLVIVDDISEFSTESQDEITNILNKLKKNSKKIISYNIEKIDLDSESIEVIPSEVKNPYLEPRILNTRIDLNNDIPYILYEYINWFMDNNNKMVVFTPDEEKLNSIYEYFTKKLKMRRISIIPLLNSEDEEIVNDVLKKVDMATIIITNKMEVKFKGSKIGNAVVLFADDDKYTYKKLVFLCSELGRINEDLPEILLVSKDTSENIEKVRDIRRHYNKVRWILSGEKH